VTLPVAVICAGWIALVDVRLACRWVGALAAGMAVVGATKILYAGWGLSLPAEDFRVLSGHTMLSTSVWIVAFALQLKWWNRSPRLGVLAGMAVGFLTGIARVMDHSHSLSEVLSGWALGALVATFFLRRALAAEVEVERSWRMWPAVSVLLVSTLAYGHKAPLQDLIDEHAPGIRRHAPAITALVHPIQERIESQGATPAR
jgi:hypothetical protein